MIAKPRQIADWTQPIVRGKFKIMDEGLMSITEAGYVGLCTAVAFAIRGNKVLAADLNPEKLALINRYTPVPRTKPKRQAEKDYKKGLSEMYFRSRRSSSKHQLHIHHCRNSEQAGWEH
jgi:UDP-N-acetyl-D-mannosaminuronate dehydrogenase